MTPVLLLVDLQNDFLARDGLAPAPAELVPRCAALLEECRRTQVPVVHAHTLVDPRRDDRMPHWRRAGHWACVRDTPGSLAPAALAPLHAEPRVRKRYYSAFEQQALDLILQRLGADTLVVAGLYLHGCVRATILDAYARGYTVWVAADCVATPEPAHGALTRTYLQARAAEFLDAAAILARLQPSPPAATTDAEPVACIDGRWRAAGAHPVREHRDPCDRSRVLARVPLGGCREVDAAVTAALAARRGWEGTPLAERGALLEQWAGLLEARAGELAGMLAAEIGKPLIEARAELARAVSLVRGALRRFEEPALARPAPERSVRYRARGVVGLITPWNNPIGIAAGKLAPALLFGNCVVWKPAPQAPRTSAALMRTLLEAGLPGGAVSLVCGDGRTARQILSHEHVHAVSLTGRSETGREAARLCAAMDKPLQAELGGNNAAIVLEDVDHGALAAQLAGAAFGFAGQRCTATRRFIVPAAARDAFEDSLRGAVRGLRVGDPQDPETLVGPLIDAPARDRLLSQVREAVADGQASLLEGGRIPPGLGAGCWLEPTLLRTDDPGVPLVQEESFGPIAVIQSAEDLEQAIGLCNGVSQGLVASLYTHDPQAQRRFLERAQAGIVRINPIAMSIDPELPFGGWKDSGLGPAEHGIWDREFYARPQALYGPGS